MSILQQNVSLQSLNTFGIPVKAAYFAEICNADDLKHIFSTDVAKNNRFLVLGGGSNWLFTKDFDGLVIKMNIPGIKVETHGADVFVTAGAGVIWNDLVNYCVENGFAGIENLALIPGTVGASPIQNIGAYGVSSKMFLNRVLHLKLRHTKPKLSILRLVSSAIGRVFSKMNLKENILLQK